jgi:hypothetical protein
MYNGADYTTVLHDACCVVRTTITAHWLLIPGFSAFIL